MSPFKYQGILSQKLLVNTPERTDKVTPRGPQPFNRIGMDLIVTIPIVVSGPLSLTVPNGVVLAVGVSQRLIGRGFIRIDRNLRLRGSFDQGHHCLLFGIGAHFQADLVGLTPNQTDQGRPIRVHSASPALLIGPRTRGILVVIVVIWPLMATILVHFIHFDRFIRQFCRQPVRQTLFLDPMTPLQQVAVVSIQFLGNLGGRISLHDAPQQQDDLTTAETDIAQHSVSENIEHPTTFSTPIGHYRRPGSVMRGLLCWQGVSFWTRQPRWLQDLFQKFVTLLLIHQISYGKWEHIFSPPASHLTTSLFDSS